MEVFSAKQALSISEQHDLALIDVRSEGEFSQGHIPGFVNLPLLNDIERHQVGLTYKNSGQEAAIKLGYDLVIPESLTRIEGWKNQIQNSLEQKGLITCWRGGLRSKLVAESILKSGFNAIQVQGGYKAMRQELTQSLANPPPFFVLSGMTGSGKTDLIRALPTNFKVDLEALAEHRGSSFGHFVSVKQPSTATFENRLALGVRDKIGPVIIEDESRGIGRVTIPNIFLQRLRTSPIIVLTAPLEQRANHIYKEYIALPHTSGMTLSKILIEVKAGLASVRKRLGGSLTDHLLQMTDSAFNQKVLSPELHISWISLLLKEYYDKLYLHSTACWKRPVLFEGDFAACNQWISHHLNLQKA
jgi:tRNA 2-selenouridine synthase